MRHSKRTKKFDRTTSHRQAMLKNLARNLIIHQQIKTTLAKAKEARRLAEKLITLAKKDTISNRRKTYSYLQDRKLVKRLFEEIAPLFKNRPGGYTRILRTTNRSGDGAQMAILALVAKKEEPKPTKVKAAGKAKEGKKVPPKTAEPAQKKEEPKDKPKVVKERPSKPKIKKKGLISGLRKYFGGREKNK